MFEKEAEEYFRENAYNFDEVTACRECMEFGYNKANEWHDLRKNPNDLPKKSKGKLYLVNIYSNSQLKFEYAEYTPTVCLWSLEWKRFEILELTVGSRIVNIKDVIAWKEIVLPIKPEEEKCERCIKSDKEIDCHKCDVQNKKHYRPFNNCSELIDWYDFTTGVINRSPRVFMPTIWIKHKRYGTENLIIAFDNDNKSIGGSCVFIQDMWIDMKELFDNFTFLDGSICGVEE